MSDDNNYISISDARVPNAGRIYDFLLGGNHNFEVDRVAAAQLKANFPEIGEYMRLIRWFLGAAVHRLCDEGFRSFLDFASGLPTVDHIHYIAPEGTTVVYSDIDPVTVSYGQEIVKDLPNVAYVRADAGTPEDILESEAVKKLIAPAEKVGIGYSGIAWFLPDEKIAHAFETLYAWAKPGTKLFVSDSLTRELVDESDKLTDFYKSLNQPLFLRPEARVRELFGKWKICDPGMQPLERWIELDPSFKQHGVLTTGATLVGTFLVKE